MEKLIEYLNLNKITFALKEANVFCIKDATYEFVETNGALLSKEYELLLPDIESDNYVILLGGRYYYIPSSEKKNPTFHLLKYVGDYKCPLPNKVFLGVHGGYEICNGSREYSDWVKKAKFFGMDYLGICEKNTLGGVLKFQLACEKGNITPIIGASYTVYRKQSDLKYDLKCYVKNEVGWSNLLKINKIVNVDNDSYIEEKDFLKLTEGLFVVLDPKFLDYEDVFPLDLSEFDCYYQLDPCEFKDNERDKEYLLRLVKYIKQNKIPPVSITDAYYLDQDDSYIKPILNSIPKNFKKTGYESHDQYFKCKFDYFQGLDKIFDENNQEFIKLMRTAIENEIEIAKSCRFKVNVKDRHLPEYELTKEEEKTYKDKDDLFWSVIRDGLIEKTPESKRQVYLDRIQEEVRVIDLGGVRDYFLILYDIVNWCRRNDIYIGIGRGSAGGSLVAYLLGITHVDPIKYGLFFERFLNEGRVQTSLPDIDLDVPGSRRGEVKQYMEDRYGANQVCSVGTYTNLKLKSVIQDLGRMEGIEPQTRNYLTTILDHEEENINGLLREACKKSVLKKFVQDHSVIVNTMHLMLMQPRTTSIHASAILILPKDKEVWDWLPVRKIVDEDTGEVHLISEWEGEEVDRAGFLKNDILGIKQLDKFYSIVKSIEEHTGDKVDIYSLPMNDKKVYDLLGEGRNSDIFHLGSKMIEAYCRRMQPEDIEEIAVTLALNRPGAMENGFHESYIGRKKGLKPIESLWGLEKVTEETLGLVVYQEQIMQACVEIGGFTLVEADDIRKAMGKKIHSLLESYREKFVEGAILKGCPEEEAIELWEMLVKFAGYGFNKSHAVAYGITGYIGQWLKVHYPLHFYSTAIAMVAEHKKQESIPRYLSEIYKTGSINVFPPEINNSDKGVRINIEKNSLFWALKSIKNVGNTSVDQIIEDRAKDGEYFSLGEFLDRHDFKNSKVTKRVIEPLIMCGAFDILEEIDDPVDRKMLIDMYRSEYKKRVDAEKDLFHSELVKQDWWWHYQQKSNAGIAFLNYEKICEIYRSNIDIFPYLDVEKVVSENSIGENGTVAGIVSEVKLRETKNGILCSLVLEVNFEFIPVTIWPDVYDEIVEEGKEIKEGQLIILNGEVKFDTYKKENSIYSNDRTEVSVLI